jgi:hypothetical protein
MVSSSLQIHKASTQNMTITIALFGAGGKTSIRLSKNLIGSPYKVKHVEPSEIGRACVPRS